MPVLVTIFLGILVLALILGNIFLSIAKPKNVEEAFLRDLRKAKSSQALQQSAEMSGSQSLQQNCEFAPGNGGSLLQQRNGEIASENGSLLLRRSQGNGIQGSNGSLFLQREQSSKNIAASNHLLQQGKIRPAFVASEQPDFRQAAESERVRMLNKRIDRMENLLLRMNGAKFVAYKMNGTDLAQKLSEIDEFKQNTSLEIAALKQQLAALKENELPEENNVVMDLSPADEERAHAIVYHGSRQ